MDTKKFLLATLAAFIGMFVVSWLVYTVIFEGYFEEAFKELPTRETPLMGILVLSQIGLALIMAFMYPKGYEGGPPIGEGLRFGILMGLFVSIGVDLGIYAYMPVAFGPILVDLIVFTVVVTVGGLLIGLVYGKPEEVVPETPEAPEPEAPPKE